MDEIASFDSITIWGHEVLPDASENPYVRGIEEWMKFAKAVCMTWRSTSTRFLTAVTDELIRSFIGTGRKPFRSITMKEDKGWHSNQLLDISGT